MTRVMEPKTCCWSHCEGALCCWLYKLHHEQEVTSWRNSRRVCRQSSLCKQLGLILLGIGGWPKSLLSGSSIGFIQMFRQTSRMTLNVTSCHSIRMKIMNGGSPRSLANPKVNVVSDHLLNSADTCPASKLMKHSDRVLLRFYRPSNAVWSHNHTSLFPHSSLGSLVSDYSFSSMPDTSGRSL